MVKKVWVLKTHIKLLAIMKDGWYKLILFNFRENVGKVPHLNFSVEFIVFEKSSPW